jgi:hypothetical protein
MIHRDEALDLLIEASPSFWSADDLHALPKSFEAGEPDLYVRMSAFAVHVVRLIELDDTAQLARIADAIEQVLDVGDADARDLMRLGFLESLQNIVSHRDVPVSSGQARAILGPRAGEVWDELAQLWADAGERHARVDGPTEAEYERIDDPELRLYFQANTRALPDGTLMSASQVLRHESDLADALRARQRKALQRWVLLIAVILLVLSAVAFLV